MTNFYTADQHWGHAGIIHHTTRPFRDVREMNEMLTRKWNEVVGHEDTVYHMGDLTLGGVEAAMEYIRRLHGDLVIIPGSHDRKWIDRAHHMRTMGGKVIRATVIHEVREGEERIVLCHYPMTSWNGSHNGAWHFSGHKHGRLGVFTRSGDTDIEDQDRRGWGVDVGVDSWGFQPVTFSRIRMAVGLGFSGVKHAS